MSEIEAFGRRHGIPKEDIQELLRRANNISEACRYSNMGDIREASAGVENFAGEFGFGVVWTGDGNFVLKQGDYFYSLPKVEAAEE